MLVVIAVILLAMTLAIPAIRSLTGSRSLEATENSLSAFINFTRTEAIGLQRTEGVIFLLDTGADRVKCAAIMDSGLQLTTDVPGVTYLDLVPDRDPYFLPTGVRLWTLKDVPPPPIVARMSGLAPPIDPFAPSSSARYLGFNPNPNPGGGLQTNGYGIPQLYGGFPATAVPGGVILFDKTGHLVTQRYGFRLNPSSLLASMLFPAANQGNPQQPMLDWPNANKPNFYLTSQIGLVLFDRETFLAQTDSVSQTQFTDANDPQGGSLETAMEAWLDANTTPVFVNRYDGNLMRAE
jgi:type II secretory pathway pseudopilin PulG